MIKIATIVVEIVQSIFLMLKIECRGVIKCLTQEEKSSNKIKKKIHTAILFVKNQ